MGSTAKSQGVRAVWGRGGHLVGKRTRPRLWRKAGLCSNGQGRQKKKAPGQDVSPGVSDSAGTEPQVTVVVDAMAGVTRRSQVLYVPEPQNRAGWAGGDAVKEPGAMWERSGGRGGQHCRGQGHGLRSQPPAPHFSPPLDTIGQITCAAFPGF